MGRPCQRKTNSAATQEDPSSTTHVVKGLTGGQRHGRRQVSRNTSLVVITKRGRNIHCQLGTVLITEGVRNIHSLVVIHWRGV